jgi:hypothetical protein
MVNLKKNEFSQIEQTRYLNVLNSGIFLNINELESIVKRHLKSFFKRKVKHLTKKQKK